MRRVDLTPAARRQLRRVRDQLRTWGLIVACYVSIAVLGIVVSRTIVVEDDEPIRALLASAQAELAAIEATTEAFERDIEQANVLLEANLSIADQPDWAALLTIISSRLGDQIVLRQMKLAEGPEGLTVTLDGLGGSQRDVTHFALRLDEVDLFHDVKLGDTKRTPFLDSHVTAFTATFVLAVPETAG